MSNIILPQYLTDDLYLCIREFFTKEFNLPAPSKIRRIGTGLINETYDIDSIWILQHINPIFRSEVNEDIAALTPILNAHRVCVPTLMTAKSGNHWADGKMYGLPAGPWRIMDKLSGETYNSVQNITQIQSLSKNLAAFHAALDKCQYSFRQIRSGVHDFYNHQRRLMQAAADHRSHRLADKVSILIEKIEHLCKFIDISSIISCETLRIIHGDPKISNFIFTNTEVTGTVDLDTMAKSRASFDVGDAIRSWCNPCTEDAEPAFNREFARESLGLYIESSPFLSRDERKSLKNAAPFITLELAMRFAKDALCEDYFGFNPEIGHGEHSLMRASSMTDLCAQMLEYGYAENY